MAIQKRKKKPASSEARRPLDSRVMMMASGVITRSPMNGIMVAIALNQADRFFEFDGLAAEFWALIDNKRTVGKIKEMLVRKHSPPVEKFDADVEKFIRRLDHLRLLVKKP